MVKVSSGRHSLSSRSVHQLRLLLILAAVSSVLLLRRSLLVMKTNAMSASAIVRSGKPYLIYGTAWKKHDTSRLVSEAIRAGFRFIDTACQPKHYNEPGVGEGWYNAAHELGLSREDLFLQTKFTPLDGQDRRNVPYDPKAKLEDQVIASISKSLENLHTSYIDSLVLHSPLETLEETLLVWQVFERFIDSGQVRQLGISNCYDLNFFEQLYSKVRIKPKVLQNRFYDTSGFDVELREFCKDHGVLYQSFWTLTANRDALADPELREMASEKGLTPQTLMYAFMMTLGHTPLDGTTNQKHMAEDIAVMERIQNGEIMFEDDELLKMSEILGIPV